MKKIKRLFTAIAVIALMIGLSGFGLNMNNGAGVTKDFSCNVFDGYGALTNTTESINVTNNGGNTTLVCHKNGVATPGVTVKQNGFGCGTSAGYTTNSQSVVSAKGNSTLRCQIKK